MEPFVRRFIRASLLWLGTGVILGLAMALDGRWVVLRPAHAHANLLGFVSMMIFGVAYHVVPRFTGHPLHSRRLPAVHLWVANLGLAGMTAGFILRPWHGGLGALLLGVGAVLGASGAALFIFNLWRTLDEPPPAPRPLPTVHATDVRASAST